MSESISESPSKGSADCCGVAIVTGAAKRLGKSIALALARDLQLDVVVHYGRSQAEADDVVEQIQRLGQKAVAVSADLRKPQQAADLVFDAAGQLGLVTTLINCAATFEDSPIGEITEKHCQHQFLVNTVAPLMLTQQFALQLTSGLRGQVINLLDWRATRPPANYLAYTASKAALASLTRGLAQQLAPRIQVNAIAPGAMLPPPDNPRWHSERAVESIPLKRTGNPDDICDAVVYLLKSGFVTGEILHVTGGEEL